MVKLDRESSVIVNSSFMIQEVLWVYTTVSSSRAYLLVSKESSRGRSIPPTANDCDKLMQTLPKDHQGHDSVQLPLYANRTYTTTASQSKSQTPRLLTETQSPHDNPYHSRAQAPIVDT